MIGLNVIWVFSPDCKKALMCKRHKEPFKGLYNLVGGKIESGESGMDAAYRELAEETGIVDINIYHLMDFIYYNHQDNRHFSHGGDGRVRVEVYFGKLNHAVEVSGDEKELVWLDTTENFFDYSRFAGEGNIGHIYEVIKRFRENEVQNVRVLYRTNYSFGFMGRCDFSGCQRDGIHWRWSVYWIEQNY